MSIFTENKKLPEFNGISINMFTELSVSGESTSHKFSIALGKSIADKLYMESGDLSITRQYEIRKLVAEINERVIIDAELVFQLVMKFMKFKQFNIDKTQFEENHLIPYNSMLDFFGLTKIFSGDDLGTIDKETKYIHNTSMKLDNVVTVCNERIKSRGGQ